MTQESVQLHTLRPKEGAVHSERRVGRGQGSGYGGTSTRGHKGAKSRSGYSRKLGFEGGQMPIQRRLPKFGFKNRFREEYRAVNLEDLQRIAETNSLEEITPELLEDLRVIKRGERFKVLGKGELSRKLTVRSHAFSASAKSAIEAVGGTAEIL